MCQTESVSEPSMKAEQEKQANKDTTADLEY